MKTITLWQPWASAVACGAKTIETRGWSTSYRGPIAIHAAAKWDNSLAQVTNRLKRDWPALQVALHRVSRRQTGTCGLPLGEVVCTATIIDCVATETLLRKGISPMEESLGDYQDGRWGWVLKDVSPLIQTVPAKGKQGFWKWEP